MGWIVPPPTNSCANALIPGVLGGQWLFWQNKAFKEVIKLIKAFRGQSDPICLRRRGNWGSGSDTRHVRMEKRPCEKTERRRPSARQEKKPNLGTPYFELLAFRIVRTQILVVSHPVSGIFHDSAGRVILIYLLRAIGKYCEERSPRKACRRCSGTAQGHVTMFSRVLVGRDSLSKDMMNMITEISCGEGFAGGGHCWYKGPGVGVHPVCGGATVEKNWLEMNEQEGVEAREPMGGTAK